MDKYLTFVEQFAVIVLDLQQKQKHNANYKNVTQVALNLYGKLKDAALFLNSPLQKALKYLNNFAMAVLMKRQEYLNNTGIYGIQFIPFSKVYWV